MWARAWRAAEQNPSLPEALSALELDEEIPEHSIVWWRRYLGFTCAHRDISLNASRMPPTPSA